MLKSLVLLFLIATGGDGAEELPKDVYEFINTLERLLEIPPEEPDLLPKYDFIIVGAGSAGCVVANRLSENPAWKILLIEAGNDENPMIDIPLMYGLLQYSSVNWNYTDKPSFKYNLGMVGRSTKWPRGRVMGGTSSINSMVYTRGNAKDYDDWEKLGNQGWSYEDVLPYFKKIENITIDSLKNSKYHNTEGYVNVGYASYKTQFADVVLKAYKEFGLNYVDYNGADQIGFSRVQTNLKDGFRHSANGAYIIPFKRSNLHIKKLATVKRVLINKHRVAYGVQFVSGGRPTVVKARNEIILSAGAINSPQLLMLSGIGPKTHLEKFKIKTIADLPVGENLMDHISVPLVYTINKPLTIAPSARSDFESYLERESFGVLSIPGAIEVIAFHGVNHKSAPDVELFYLASSMASNEVTHKLINIKTSIYDTIYKPISRKYSFMASPILLTPKSRGSIKLASADYRDHPILNANYFDHPDDIKTLIAGMKLSLNISRQPAFKKIGAKFSAIPMQECPYETQSDDYLECLCRTLTMSTYHFSGTCKMGPRQDPTAVVDDRLRVHGVKKLRVIDASIMPVIVRAHTNSPTMMIGEKGADLIKEDWLQI